MRIGDSMNHAGEVASDIGTWVSMIVVAVGVLLLVVSLVRQSRSQTSENDDDEG